MAGKLIPDMKKKYKINVHYDAVISVCVIAESEEEAEELAYEEAENLSLEDADVVGSSCCITGSEIIKE